MRNNTCLHELFRDNVDFENDPEMAVLLWHANAGLVVDDPLDRLPELDAIQAIEDEISNEILSDTEKHKLISDFMCARGREWYMDCKTRNHEARIVTCGACGIRDVKRGSVTYMRVPLTMLNCLRVEDDAKIAFKQELEDPPIYLPVNCSGLLRPFHLHKARNIYVSGNGEMYYLHPDMVERDHKGVPYVHLCGKCHASAVGEGNAPIRSLKYVEMGNPFRLGLEPLTPMERAIIAKIRHYCIVIKIQDNAEDAMRSDYSCNPIRGHAILFPHDSSNVAPSSLLRTAWKVANVVRLHFVGPDNVIDRLICRTFNQQSSSIFGRWHGLANGSPVVYHSITMASEAEQDKVIQWMQLNPPGSILTLERPPLSLNIVVAIKNSKDNILTQLTRDEDIGLDLSTSLVCETDEENIPCKIIVPIPCLPKMSEWHKRSISGNRSMGYGPSKAEVRDYFKAEMAMAITTHKAEGRTMDRIVLALQDRPTKIVQMTYTSILVALSRVHRREDVRILMSGEYGYRSLEYILDLKPSPYLNLFFAGYENNREEWNADLVVSRYRKLHRAIGRL